MKLEGDVVARHDVGLQGMELWNRLRTPPKWALKKITGGRLAGFTDISPQWRIGAMTEVFGPCGIGWKYEIGEIWTLAGSMAHQEANGTVALFARVNVFICLGNGTWSDPIPGVGGSTLIAKEKGGLYMSDEAVKMAVTDALGVAMKALGMGADVYCNGEQTKYLRAPDPNADNAGKQSSDEVHAQEEPESTSVEVDAAQEPEEPEADNAQVVSTRHKVYREMVKEAKSRGVTQDDFMICMEKLNISNADLKRGIGMDEWAKLCEKVKEFYRESVDEA